MLSTHQRTLKTHVTKLVDVFISEMCLRMLVDTKSGKISKRDCKGWSWRDKKESAKRSLKVKSLKNVLCKKKKLCGSSKCGKKQRKGERHTRTS